MHASEKGVNTTILGVNNDLPWCQEDVSHFLASLPAPWCRGNPWSGPQNDGVPLFNVHEPTTHTTSRYGHSAKALAAVRLVVDDSTHMPNDTGQRHPSQPSSTSAEARAWQRQGRRECTRYLRNESDDFARPPHASATQRASRATAILR